MGKELEKKGVVRELVGLRLVRRIDTLNCRTEETDVHQVPDALDLTHTPVIPRKVRQFAKATYSGH